MEKRNNALPPAPQLLHLGGYLDKLPPMIARKGVKYFTGGLISPKKLANDDSAGKGPLVRQKIGEGVVYPTPYFLAYLEAQGVHVIAVPQL